MSESKKKPKKKVGSNNKERKYKNNTVYNRVEHNEKHPYTKISNYLIKDQRLTFTELGFMVWALSNQDTYVFNSDFTRENISGIGHDSFDKAKKNLLKYGYLEMERGYGYWDYVINECPKPSLNGTKLENTECVSQTCGNPQMLKSTDVENPPLIITNPLTAEPAKKETIENRNNIEIITKQKPDLDENLKISISSVKVQLEVLDQSDNSSPIVKDPDIDFKPNISIPTGVNDLDMIANSNISIPKVKPDLELNSKPDISIPMVKKESDRKPDISIPKPTNDLDLVLDQVQWFKTIYDNAKWNEINISNFSNSFIAYAVRLQLENTPRTEIPSKTYYYLQMLVKYSQRLESDLWKCFQLECKDNPKLMDKLFYNAQS